MLGTIMAANVFFVIIPMHWKLVHAKEAGEEPDPAWNARGKQRSVHNNYLTLPVVFAMLSNHFPFTYGHDHAWLDPRVPDGARGADPPLLQPPAHRAERLVDPRGRRRGDASRSRSRSGRSRARRTCPARRRASRPSSAIVANRCAPCHSLNPTEPGYSSPPAGIVARDRRADQDRRRVDPDRRRSTRRRCRSGTRPG